jgi:hypothetical protein
MEATMRLMELAMPRRAMLACLVLACISSNAPAQIYKLPVPPECSSTKKLTLTRAGHPEKFTSYGKVSLYCGTSAKAFVTGATLCDSDYDSDKPDQKTVTIAVSTQIKSGKVAACKNGEELKFTPESESQ